MSCDVVFLDVIGEVFYPNPPGPGGEGREDNTKYLETNTESTG